MKRAAAFALILFSTVSSFAGQTPAQELEQRLHDLAITSQPQLKGEYDASRLLFFSDMLAVVEQLQAAGKNEKCFSDFKKAHQKLRPVAVAEDGLMAGTLCDVVGFTHGKSTPYNRSDRTASDIPGLRSFPIPKARLLVRPQGSETVIETHRIPIEGPSQRSRWSDNVDVLKNAWELSKAIDKILKVADSAIAEGLLDLDSISSSPRAGVAMQPAAGMQGNAAVASSAYEPIRPLSTEDENAAIKATRAMGKPTFSFGGLTLGMRLSEIEKSFEGINIVFIDGASVPMGRMVEKHIGYSYSWKYVLPSLPDWLKRWGGDVLVNRVFVGLFDASVKDVTTAANPYAAQPICHLIVADGGTAQMKGCLLSCLYYHDQFGLIGYEFFFDKNIDEEILVNVLDERGFSIKYFIPEKVGGEQRWWESKKTEDRDVVIYINGLTWKPGYSGPQHMKVRWEKPWRQISDLIRSQASKKQKEAVQKKTKNLGF